MERQRVLSALLCIALTAANFFAISCGNNDMPQTDDESTESTSSDDTTVKEKEYEYPDADFGGEDFNILNTSTTWGFYTNLDFDEVTGETLDDAVYNRNRFIEDKFNFNFVIDEVDTDSMYNRYRSVVMSAEDVYDVVFCRADRMSSFIIENYLTDLGTISSLQLDQPWWDSDIVKASQLGNSKSAYVAGSDILIYNLQGVSTLYINEDMLSDLNGTAPYDLVREGKWTLDKLREYIALGTNLNGDESFTWNINGAATYGLMSFDDAAISLLAGSDLNYIKIDKDGTPYLAAENDKFYSVASKIADLLGTEGEFLYLNTGGTDNHYEVQFKNDRALMILGHIKSASKFRDMQSAYGILPIPKYDENQEEYYCYRSGRMPLMSIPVTNNNPECAGVIMDAMSYLSYRDVLPIFYKSTLSQKQLRNDDSLEMLEIIRNSRYLDISRIYGWSDALYDSVQNALFAGNGNIASMVASNKSVIEANIQKTLDLFNK